MSVLDSLAGTATAGTLYGIGVGPGDARYLTLRAAGLVQAVDVVAYFAKIGSPGNARRIVAPLLAEGRAEMRLEYPVTDEVPADSLEYQQKIGAFYRADGRRPGGRCCDKVSRSACWPRAIPSSMARSCICGAVSALIFRSRSCRA